MTDQADQTTMDHRQIALDKQAAGDLFDANLHALLYVGDQIARVAKELAPTVTYAVEKPAFNVADGVDPEKAARLVEAMKAPNRGYASGGYMSRPATTSVTVGHGGQGGNGYAGARG